MEYSIEQVDVPSTPNLIPSLQAFSRKASIAVIAIGCIVIIGWMFNIPLFKSILPGLVTMKANTALCFIFAGAALWMWHQSHGTGNNSVLHAQATPTTQNFLRWAQVCAALVLLIGLLTLIQYGLNGDFGIDQFLFKDSAKAAGTSAPGRMGANTAANFVMVGCALLFLVRNYTNYRVAQIFTLGAFFVAFVGLLGYAYSVTSLYGINSYTQMALHTAITFSILCIGILCARPDRGVMQIVTTQNAGGMMARRLASAAIGIPPVVGWFILAGYRAKNYNTELAISLQAVFNIAVFGVLIWWTAKNLSTIDLKRQRAEEKLRTLNAELEERVNQRTTELTKSNHELQQLQNEFKMRQDALNEAAIVSETDREGIITYANNRFCEISGYSREELIGQNHNIINSKHHPPSFFADMWATIYRGNVWKAEIKNKRKDGSFYWVDSTIAPIFDTNSQIVKYIAIRFDITELKEAEERLQKLAAERQTEADSLSQQVLKLLNEIKGAAKGDLTVRAQVTNDILGAVADSFNFLISSLRKVVNGIQDLSSEVRTATSTSITDTSQLADRAHDQAQQIDGMLQQIERMVNSIKDVSDVAKRAEQVAEQARQTAETGGLAVDRTVEGINELRQTIAQTSKMMKRLGESSQQIGKIVNSISQIAAQTNLLALNATIEAARAGEHGQGFAVVAEEVRKLAERSASATEEISDIVSTIKDEISRVITTMDSGTQEVVEGTQLAAEAKTNLIAIIEVSREMNGLIQNITRAAKKQVTFAEQISGSMRQVNTISTTTSQKALEVQASLHGLSVAVNKLQGSVANFRS
ncbi:methyl-accepting chemotaxis protein [Argonema galeatum]|uniref:methyl-accepting chemotaxis protein n=1 Tax=Argonema galeatum TaxID=2942762 RepID=UPI0020124B29|nr:methyl-accepting chemotaxis protein [Argonema galeatum]MCL1465420.1 methyl-accepting chemotaxis protein [Argonema galeatum A003/A1]